MFVSLVCECCSLAAPRRQIGGDGLVDMCCDILDGKDEDTMPFIWSMTLSSRRSHLLVELLLALVDQYDDEQLTRGTATPIK